MTATSIQWTDATWNPVRGCALVSPGCANCYAMKQAHRFSGPGQPYEGLTRPGRAVWNGRARFVPEMLGEPLRWQKPKRVFVNSMSDLFHDDVSNEQIAAIFGVMAACPQHTFQVLTKRPERMRAWFEWHREATEADGEPWIPLLRETVCWLSDAQAEAIHEGGRARHGVPQLEPWPLPNVWLGVSAENQKAADERIPLLLRTPAAVRFVSAEPLLGELDLTHLDADGAGHPELCQVDALTGRHTDMGRPCPDTAKLDWVIVGGESGPGARICEVAWIERVVRDCAAARVPCFVKQLGAVPALSVEPTGEWRTVKGGRQLRLQVTMVPVSDRKGGDPSEWPEALRVRQFPEQTAAVAAVKSTAEGRGR